MKRLEEYLFYFITPALLLLYMFASNKAKGDNEIFIDQTGNNFAILGVQYGDNNTITIDGTGDNNGIKLCQGCAFDYPESYTNHDHWTDDWESGGHTMDLTINGSGNGISAQQTNQGNAGNNAHSYELNLSGDYNEVTTIQQHDGAKTIDLTIYNDDNDVLIRQKGNGANHNATVELDGTYGTDVTLKQFGSLTQTYSLTQNCLNPSGCSISVTQQ
jgi:hypothetical protein